MSTSMDIAKKFDGLLTEGKFEEACELLTDDFVFSNPRTHIDKGNFVKDFPAMHKDAPTFEDFQEGANDLQITRKGKKRIAMMNISMKETWEFTNDGKIKSIVGAKA